MLRVTTGCVTCRIRRVKCDEGKPECTRCKTTGRKCEGYVNAPLSRKGLGPSVNARLRDQGSGKPGSVMLFTPSDISFSDDRDVRSFDFFRSCSVPNTNMFVTDEFWSRTLLQAIPAEPCIKHGVLALGAIHRYFESAKEDDHSYAVEQYGKAVRLMGNALGAKDESGMSHNILLMSIILLHCFETHNQNFTASGLHLKAGMRLLEEAKTPQKRKTQPAKSDAVMDEITRTLHRLDVHDLTFSDQSAPYEWPEKLYSTDEPSMPESLDTVGQARDVLMALFKRSAHVTAAELSRNMGQPADVTPANLAKRRIEISADLTKWKRLMLEQVRRPDTSSLYPSPASFMLFESYYTVAVMNLSVSATGLETTWDMYISQCSYLVKNLANLFGTRYPDAGLGTSRHVSYDLGIVAPLFWIAIKCRDPLIRREAIAVLSSAQRREGKWSSIGAAYVAQAVVDLEEEIPCSVLRAVDIPERNRVHLVMPRLNPQTKIVDLVFWRRSGPDGSWRPEQKTMPV